MERDQMTVEKNLNQAPQYIQDISCKWFWQAPFFSTFLQNFKYVEEESCPTIGVSAKDGTITLHVGTNGWFADLSDEHKQSVLVHEILHLVHETHFNSRGKCYSPQVFNVAADICINDEIEKSSLAGRKMVLPRPGCFLEMVTKEGYKGNVITEEIYEFLMDNKDKFNIQEQMVLDMSGEGKDGQGESAGGKKTVLKPFDVHKGLDKNEGSGVDEMTKAVVQGITHVAKMRGYGNMSGNMQEFVKILTTSRINWKQLLRKFIKSTSTGSMFKMNNWSKANRRHLPLPGKKKHNAEYVIAVDTSGSISSEELAMFFAEIDKIATFAEIRLLQCDTQLTDSGKYKKGSISKVKIKGRGGTELSPIFKYMSETEELKKSKLIVLTDAEFCYDFNTFGIDTLWAVTKSGENYIADMQKKFSNHKYLVLEDV